MSGKVLYRKYRPTKLEDVVGQPQVTDALQNSLSQGKVGHAYLFIGPRGTGKTSVARIFAHAVNDFAYDVEDSYLDIIEIDAASNTGVDNIRELREKAVIAPTAGKYKVYIIDEVHMLTKSASNALLKTLEEPPEHVIFIMATTDAHKVPITISSRTQVFSFKLANPETMLAHLQAIAQQEGIKITDDALKLVVKRGGGSFRDSLSLLDQVATLSNGEITAELLSNALGLPQDQAVQELLTAHTSGDQTQIHQLLQDLLNTGIKPEIIASELIEAIIERPEPAYFDLLARLPEVQPPFPEAKLLLALLTSPAANPAPTATNTTRNVVNFTTPRKAAPSPKVVSSASSSKTTSTVANSATKAASQATPTSTPNNNTAPEVAAAPVKAASESSADSPNDQLAASGASGDFNWEDFLSAVHEANTAIYQQLLKSDYEVVDNILHLYPSQKFTKTILERPGNSQIMLKFLESLGVKVHDVGEKQPPKDETLSQISAIMGDVREVEGDLPF